MSSRPVGDGYEWPHQLLKRVLGQYDTGRHSPFGKFEQLPPNSKCEDEEAATGRKKPSGGLDLLYATADAAIFDAFSLRSGDGRDILAADSLRGPSIVNVAAFIPVSSSSSYVTLALGPDGNATLPSFVERQGL
jgi:hypothetical protein